MASQQQYISIIKKIIIALSFGLFAFVFWAILQHPDAGFDWLHTFGPAGRKWWAPYEVLYHNPPWIALLLWPLAVLPYSLGIIVNNLAAVLATILFIQKEAKERAWIAILATLLSPFFYQLLFVSNIDWIVILGLIVAGRWSLPLLAAKPQAVLHVPLHYFRLAENRWRFWLPSIAIGLASLAIWGFWPADIPAIPDLAFLNASPFPWAVPVGIFIIWKTWNKEDALLWVLLASALISPYFRFSSLVPLMAAASIRYPRLMFSLVAAFWIIVGLVII